MKVKESLSENRFFHKMFPHHSKSKNMREFIQILQKRVNTQIQDRICYDYIPSIKGYTFTVLDGHGSKQCAEFAYKKINHFVRKRFEQNKQLKLSLKKSVQKSLTEAFEDVQNQWHKVYEKHFGEDKFKRSGACCLTAVVFQNTIHIANAGDCQGALLGQHQPVKTNRRLNADQPQQMKRLRREFPHEKNLIVQRQNDQKTSCYVKGLLKPTRALGDFQLKEQKSSKTIMSSFKGPYIDYKPIFSHFKFKPESKFLILATDGMWDQIDLETVDHIVRTTNEKIAHELFQACMDSITNRNKMTEKQLNQFSYKRPFHDDISIIVIDLQKLKHTLTTE